MRLGVLADTHVPGRARVLPHLVVETFTEQQVDLILFAGDLNTHTFPRGSFLRSVRGFLRLACTPRERLAQQLMEPWRDNREPLFAHLRRGGYHWQDLNDRQSTARAPLHTIDEGAGLPRLLDRPLARLLATDSGGLPLRLDWFAARGRVEPVGSPGPRAVPELHGTDKPSDHAPIVLEIVSSAGAIR